MDPIGASIYHFYFHQDRELIRVDSNYTEDEEIDPAWFFRTFQDMPELEKIALELCCGNVLDVGAGAGCHALELQERGLGVVALEQSELAVTVMQQRGVKNVVQGNILDLDNHNFDTIILLMNGAGIAGTLRGLKELLLHLKSLLSPGGQILLDSSDISYLFEEEDGSIWLDLANDNYYGEMEYTVHYKDHYAKFPWLFVDYESLSRAATDAGLNIRLEAQGQESNYLARLTLPVAG